MSRRYLTSHDRNGVPAPRAAQRGASVLEFTLCVPVFFMAVMGTLEFGRAIFAANELNHLARDAVRYAAVHGKDSYAPTTTKEMTAWVRARSIGIAGDEIEVQTAWNPSNAPGAFVEVTLRYDFQPVVTFLPQGLRNLRGYARGIIVN